MEAYLALLLSTFGGTVAGPVFVRLAGGDATAGVVAGLLGGVAVHYGAAALGIGEVPGPVLGPIPGPVLGEPMDGRTWCGMRSIFPRARLAAAWRPGSPVW
jgi:hypothetical protein